MAHDDRLRHAEFGGLADPYALPVSLSIGDDVLIEGAGAYTTTYSSVAFNGFPPLKLYVI